MFVQGIRAGVRWRKQFLAVNGRKGLSSTSAGIFADNKAPAAGNAIKVLEENGIELKHQSKQLELEDILEASYVFTMTAGHKMLLMDQHPGAADKIFTLKEFVNGRGGDLDVNDPFGGNLAEYQATFEELKDLINRLPGLMGEVVIFSKKQRGVSF